jgi:hypothetical protein
MFAEGEAKKKKVNPNVLQPTCTVIKTVTELLNRMDLHCMNLQIPQIKEKSPL